MTLTGTRDNGVLTLNGSAPNASVESNLTFDGNILTAIGSGNYQAAISGSTAAAYTQLYINGTGRAYGIGVGNASETTYGVPNEFFLFDHNAAAMRLVVDANGNVGIGTASPINRLQIAGNVSASSYTSSVLNGVGFLGTSSVASTSISSSYALTSSYALNAGAGAGFPFSGTAFSEYNDVVVATLRSRGISLYNSTSAGPTYQVTGLTDVGISTVGSYSAITRNPFSTFAITGTTVENENFSFETSLQNSDSEYITKVFSVSNFAKLRFEVPLFVEEVYQNIGRAFALDCIETQRPARVSCLEHLGRTI